MTAAHLEWSPRANARFAGALYVIGIAAGLFAEIGVRGSLIAWGDAAATASQIRNAAELYRLGFAAGVLILMINIFLATFYYRLFKASNPSAALIIAFATIAGTAIESANLLNHYAPLVLLGEASYLEALTPEQRQALAMVDLRLFSIGYSVALCFYALYDIAAGYAILRSRLIPGIVGVLMILAGLCYLTNSFALFVAPALASALYPFILLPCFIGEASLALWLLIMGVNGDRWREHDARARAMPPTPQN
jgi:hypothetical protein